MKVLDRLIEGEIKDTYLSPDTALSKQRQVQGSSCFD